MKKTKILPYNPKLKNLARSLRKNMTDSEKLLWSKLRKKQILGIQFYRQKPIANYIIDFYAPKIKLAIEIDGSQHYETNHKQKDEERDCYLGKLDILVLRFNSREVLKNIEGVVEKIFRVAKQRQQ